VTADRVVQTAQELLILEKKEKKDW
jgi:hypothetical protein